GKQLGGDVYQAEQHRLAQLELGTEPNHRMKDTARQTPAAASDEADVLRQPPELGVPPPQAPAQPARRVPPPAERPGTAHAGHALPHSFSRQDDVAGDL